MIEIQGIQLLELPYTLHEVGILLFAYYPTTIIYSDNDGYPIIKEWVDCSDDNNIDRFFFYKIDKISLKLFIEGTMSHLELINSSQESFVIFQDIEAGKILNTSLLSLNQIPFKYKPVETFLFDRNDGVDVDNIINHFQLADIELKTVTLGLVKDISLKNNAETLYVKLNKGRGIGHGTINTEIFGKTLVNIDKLYKSIALDSILGENRGEISLEAKENEQYLQYTETVLYDNRIAASYGFLLRPMTAPQMDLFNGETQTEKIAIKAFSLISNSKDTESLKEEYILHSGFTIKFYKQFLDGILKTQLNIDLTWFNPSNKKEITDNISYLSASKIILDIDQLTTTATKEFKAKGKFRAVHCDTGHYNFVTLNEEQYSGYFDKSIREGLVNINFIDIYEVSISRKMIKEAGKKEDKIIDSITSFYLDT